MARGANEEQEWLYAPDDLVGYFRIMRPIGAGGMAEVYLARDSKLGRRVALKVIKPQRLGSAEEVKRFIIEARITARFNHPHIITIHDVGQHEDRPYVALEYLEGESLRHRLDQEVPSIQETFRIARDVAEALVAAHGAGILHRDLKPENVMLGQDGQLRVVDFGLATVMEKEAAGTLDEMLDTDRDSGVSESLNPLRSTRPGLSGTPAYMSPEQWQGDRCTGETDVWALGCILYELVTGGRPYTKTSQVQQALAVCGEEPAPALERQPGDPPQLSPLVARCLAKRAEDRPPVAEVLEALEEMLAPAGPSTQELEESPFRGLLPFDEHHSPLFFGRDAEVGAFMERLRQVPVLPVVGPSGAGKSSFVKAGAVPRLRERGPLTLIQLRPGANPIETLAARLLEAQGEPANAPAAGRLAARLAGTPWLLNLELFKLAEATDSAVLLLVDQLEELYTLTDDEDLRRRFMQIICAAADDPQTPVRVIFTLREEFLGRLAEGAAVSRVLSNITVLRRPEPGALQQILRRPVKLAGYAYDDDDLVEEMVAEVQQETSCLPLLQFAGQMLWNGRDEEQRLLLRSTYEELGGVAGALARHADGVLSGFSPGQRSQARTMLLKLVTADGTRRVLTRGRVLEGLEAEAAVVLQRLVGARLLSVSQSDDEGEAELELVHESLVNSWGKLRRWIDESRDELRLLAEIDAAAELWQQRGQLATEVWQGEALAEARRSLERHDAQLTGLSRRFIKASEARELRHQRRRRLVLAAAVALLAAVAMASGVVALVLARKERVARLRSAEAQREGARAALARGDLLEARARLRGSFQIQDSPLARALWWRLQKSPLLWRHDLGAAVNAVAFTPDGGQVAVGSQDRSVHLFNVRTRQVRVLRGHKDQVIGLHFSRDGRRLASGSWDGEIRVWDLGNPRARPRVLTGHTDAVHAVRFVGDQLLASASTDKTVRLWDQRTGKLLRVMRGHAKAIWAMDVTADGALLATSDADHTIRLWQLPAGEPAGVLRGHKGPIYGLDVDPEGRLLASASLDSTIRLWRLPAGEPVRTIKGHKGGVISVRFSGDGGLLASGSRDKSVRLWRVATGEQVAAFTGHTSSVWSVDFHPDGKLLASGAMDKTLRLWRVDRAARKRPRYQASASWGVALGPRGKLLAAGGPDKALRLFSVATGELVRTLRGHSEAIWSVAFHPDGELVASASLDRTVRLWHVATGKQVKELRGHTGRVFGMDISPDGKLLASGGMDRTVRLWRLPGGELAHVLKGHGGSVYSINFSPDSERLASADTVGTIRVWDVEAGASLHELRGHEGGIWGARFGAPGQLVSGGRDGTVRLWDATTGSGRVLARPGGRVYVLDFHTSGRVGVPLADGSVQIFNTAGRKLAVMRGHKAEVNIFRFSVDGKLAATASDDATVRLWETATGRPVWHAPLLRAEPLELYSMGRWRSLSGAAAPAGGEGWRKAVEQRARLASEDVATRLLCMRTHDGALEMWDQRADRRLGRRAVIGLSRVLATSAGCVTLGGAGALQLHPRGGATPQALAREVAAVGRHEGRLLVASASAVSVMDSKGAVHSRVPSGPGVTAVTRAGPWLVLGFRDGNIELLPTARRKRKPGFSFEDTPSSPVQRLAPGPMGTLIAGYANGLVGLWSLRNGKHLESRQLHGPVAHLLLRKGKLYAASELGQHLTMNLSSFHADYCELLRNIWREVPVVWEDGLPRERSAPDDHSCVVQ